MKIVMLRTCYLLTLLGLIPLNFLFAQEIKVYSGAFEKGNAKYQYYESNGERVYHGKFVYVQDLSGGNINYNTSIYEITQCSYEHGKLQGEYSIDRVTFKASFRVGIPINEDEYWIASFDNSNEVDFIRRTKYNYTSGKLNGAFSYEELHFKQGQLDKTEYEKITANIREDFFIGTYKHESINVLGTFKILGEFDTLGYLDKTWEFDFQNKYSESFPIGEYKETRVYTNGFLLSVKLFNLQTGKIFYEQDLSAQTSFNSKYYKPYDWTMAIVEQKFPDRANEHPVYYPTGYKDYSGSDGRIGKPIIAMLAPWFATPLVKGRGYVLDLPDEDKKLIYGSDGKLNPSVFINLKLLYKKEAYSTGGLLPELSNYINENIFSKLNINSYNLDESSYPKMFEGIKFDITELKAIDQYLNDLRLAYDEFNSIMNVINYCWTLKSTTEFSSSDDATKLAYPIEFKSLELNMNEKLANFRKEMFDYYSINFTQAGSDLKQFNIAIAENLKIWLKTKSQLGYYNQVIAEVNSIKPELWSKESDVFQGIQKEVFEPFVKPEITKAIENYDALTEKSLTATIAYLQGLKKVYISFDETWKKESTSVVTDPSREKTLEDLVTYKGKTYKEAFENTIGYKFGN